MSRNFLAAPFAPYLGQLSSKPFSKNVFGQKGLMVAARVFWPGYNVAGSPLGNANPQFNVIVDLNAAASNIVSQLWTIQSVYVDNQGVDFPVYVYFPDTQFPLSCPANSTGWYSVYTAARKAFVVAFGVTDIAISQQAATTVFFTDVTMTPYLDQENQTAIEFGLASPSISLGGNGGAVLSITPTFGGSCYNGGGLTVTGGGGAGCTAIGFLDGFGSFTKVTVQTQGAGYSAFPKISPTAGQTAPPIWTPGFYAQASLRQYNLLTYYNLTGGNSFVPPPNDPATWLQGATINATAVFSTTLSPITGGNSISTSSNYGASALGDQSRNFIDVIAGPLIRDNIFNTPQNSGYIYLTHAHVVQLDSGPTATWVLAGVNSGTLFTFGTRSDPGTLLDIQKANIKLDATDTWQLVNLGTTNALKVSHSFTWTASSF